MDDPLSFHHSTLVVDGHADTPQRFADESWDFTGPLGAGHLNLETARAGGLDAEFFAIWVEPSEWQGRFRERALQLIRSVEQQVARHPDAMRLCRTAAEVRQAKTDGIFAVLLGLEGGHAIENSLELLRQYSELGVRYMTLTWTNSNEWADSSGDLHDPAVQHHGGLTSFGREVIREMNRLGMMVDVSHVSDATFLDVLRTSKAPVIASHSSARALCGSPRNLTDEQLRAVATSNGVVQVNFYAAFLDDGFREAWKTTEPERHARLLEAEKPYRERGEPLPYAISLEIDRRFYAERMSGSVPLPAFECLVDHLDHVARVAGIDHVGLGSDFDGFSLLPQGVRNAGDLPKMTAALAARGYTAHQLEKLLGGNLLRVMAQVEAVAAAGLA
jgi:membrane dipeptidase